MANVKYNTPFVKTAGDTKLTGPMNYSALANLAEHDFNLKNALPHINVGEIGENDLFVYVENGPSRDASGKLAILIRGISGKGDDYFPSDFDVQDDKKIYFQPQQYFNACREGEADRAIKGSGNDLLLSNDGLPTTDDVKAFVAEEAVYAARGRDVKVGDDYITAPVKADEFLTAFMADKLEDKRTSDVAALKTYVEKNNEDKQLQTLSIKSPDGANIILFGREIGDSSNFKIRLNRQLKVDSVYDLTKGNFINLDAPIILKLNDNISKDPNFAPLEGENGIETLIKGVKSQLIAMNNRNPEFDRILAEAARKEFVGSSIPYNKTAEDELSLPA